MDSKQLPAGQEATAAFYGLHRGEVLQTPRYAAYRIGTIQGETEKITKSRIGKLSEVPYAEPMSLTPSYKPSPYFKESHYAVQRGEWGPREAEQGKYLNADSRPSEQRCENLSTCMSIPMLRPAKRVESGLIRS